MKYEFKTVRAIRGTESMMIGKLQKEGWELNGQGPTSLLRSELKFRRVKPKAPWRVMVAAGVLGVMTVVGIGIGALTEGHAPAAAAVASTPHASPALPQAEHSAMPAPTPTRSPTVAVMTAKNSWALSRLLVVRDPASNYVGAFASRYAGRTVEFDGHIDAMLKFDSVRYDILVHAGNYNGGNSLLGPNFQFQNADIYTDLHYKGQNIPDTIGVGDNLHIVARVVGYNSTQELFFLEPVSTEFR